ncbi:copper amine oxidase N-terminal domain-containing protein [Paenibacillus wynnii]|uniref:copper amine oxidase N-terminal domain-containing protein n=1 Tax=Paenibacillus wynnii TaxID=268407 RepID=UPI002791C48D|nr:copper amine oxidase N-terminal domain-containing protein [Paenibacillus wynnii]MDQ0194385.1 hypothetical protein [Paenibacillus wynnii]
MNCTLKIGFSGLALTLVFSAGAYAATAVPQIFVNSNQVITSTPAKIINGFVYVPLRAISEGLGVEIQWDNQSKTVYVDSDPRFEREISSVAYVSNQNLAYKWIIAYDERQHQEVLELVSPDFITDIYNESFPAGTYNMATIVDFKAIALTDNSLTVRIVQRVTAEDDYKIKVEKWKFTYSQSKISSVKVVPNSTKYLDRYTVFPGANFGI